MNSSLHNRQFRSRAVRAILSPSYKFRPVHQDAFSQLVLQCSLTKRPPPVQITYLTDFVHSTVLSLTKMTINGGLIELNVAFRRSLLGKFQTILCPSYGAIFVDSF